MAERVRPYLFYDTAVSICSRCSRRVEAKIVFELIIMQFIDAYSFDLRPVKKARVHIAHPDGKRLIPFDTYSLFYRDALEETVLGPLRKEKESFLPDTPNRGSVIKGVGLSFGFLNRRRVHGFAQLLWVIPAIGYFRKRQETETAEGIAIGAGIIALPNAACWGAMFTMI